MSRLIEDDAYVLFARPQGETSAWLSVFTQQNGRVQLTYKGGKKRLSVCAGFQSVRLSWRLGKQGGAWLVSCEPTLLYNPPLFGMANWSGLYVNEILHRGLVLNTPSPTLFLAYQQLIEALRTAGDNRRAMAWALRCFEWVFLAETGYALPLSASDGQPIIADASYLWHNDAWERCEQGILGAELLAVAGQSVSGIASGALREFLQWRLLQAMPREALSMRQWWEQLQ